MQNYHKFVYDVHKPADAVYWTFINKKKRKGENVYEWKSIELHLNKLAIR